MSFELCKKENMKLIKSYKKEVNKMIDYREVNYSPEDLDSVRRRIRNAALTVDEMIESLSDAEIAAMWFEIEEEYKYYFSGEDAAHKIFFLYLRETLLKNIVADVCDLNNQELRHYFEYWYTLHH